MLECVQVRTHFDSPTPHYSSCTTPAAHYSSCTTPLLTRLPARRCCTALRSCGPRQGSAPLATESTPFAASFSRRSRRGFGSSRAVRHDAARCSADESAPLPAEARLADALGEDSSEGAIAGLRAQLAEQHARLRKLEPLAGRAEAAEAEQRRCAASCQGWYSHQWLSTGGGGGAARPAAGPRAGKAAPRQPEKQPGDGQNAGQGAPQLVRVYESPPPGLHHAEPEAREISQPSRFDYTGVPAFGDPCGISGDIAVRYIAVYTTSLDCRRHKQLLWSQHVLSEGGCCMAMGCCLQAVPSPPRATGLARREETAKNPSFF